MTTEELLSKLRAKVEQIKKGYEIYLARITKEDVLTDLDDILSFLDTLQEQKVKEQKSQDTVEVIRDLRQIAFMIENGRRCGVIEGRKQVIDNPEKYGLQKH